MRVNQKYIWLLAIIGTVFGIMFLLNAWMPLHRDDYDYAMVWKTGLHIQSWSDVFSSLDRHYFLHGGRLVSFFFLDTFLWLGKGWFNPVNAGLFVGLILLICFHARRQVTRHLEPVELGAAALLGWLSFPHFGEVVVWMCGATVYLWTGFLAALFLLPYNLQLAGRLHWSSPGWAVLMGLGGILAGWSVENLAVTVTLTATGAAWYASRQGRMPCWMPAGAVGALLGMIGLITAPGNYVRYDQQGNDKNILDHLGNLIAGNAEMVLYLLPAILLILLSWRLLKAELLRRQGGILQPADSRFRLQSLVPVGGLLLLAFSYFHGGFVAAAIRDFIIAYVLYPLNLVQAQTILLFTNLMAGFEEMVIYWLSIFFCYSLLKQRLGLHAHNCCLLRQISARSVWQAFPAVRYAALLFALAEFNNLVMLAAPTFPVRATFSSVILILMGTMVILRIPIVYQQLFLGRSGCVLRIGAAVVGLFTVSAALLITQTMHEENARRIAVIEATAQAGQPVATLPPIAWSNRALRHVYFEDFNNDVTKDGLCEYYGLQDIRVVPGTRLP